MSVSATHPSADTASARPAPRRTVLERLGEAPFVYPLKVALTAVLTLYAAFLLNLEHTFWALLTVPLIVRPAAGSMVWRSLARLCGTALGSTAGFVIAVTFGQSAVAALGAVALVIVAIGYMARLQSGMDAYAYGVAGFTTLIIAIDAGPHVDTAFAYAVARATETAIPIVCGFVVLLVVFPRSASSDALAKLRTARGLALHIAADFVDPGATADPAQQDELLGLITLAHADVRSLAYERNRRQWLRPRLSRVANSCHGLVVVAETERIARHALAHTTPPPPQADAPDGHEAHRTDPARLDVRRSELVTALREAADVPFDASALARAAARMQALAAQIDPAAILPPYSERTLADYPLGNAAFRLNRVATAAAGLMAEAAAVADPSRPAVAGRTISHRYRDRLAALQYGLRPAAVLCVLATLWLNTGWPEGTLLTTLGSALVLMMPVMIPRPKRGTAGISIAKGLIAGTIAATLLLAMLPVLEGFPALALLLGSAYFVIFRVVGDPANFPIALGATLPIALGLMPSNTPVYAPGTLYNAVIMLALIPVVFNSALTIIFPEDAAWVRRHLRRAVTRLSAQALRPNPISRDRFVEHMVDVMGDYGASVAADDSEGQHLRRRGRAALIVGLEGYNMRQLEAEPIPPDLVALGPVVRRAAARAATLRGDADSRPEAVRAGTALRAADNTSAMPSGAPYSAARYSMAQRDGAGDNAERDTILATLDNALATLAEAVHAGRAAAAVVPALRWGASVTIIREVVAAGALAITADPPAPTTGAIMGNADAS